MTSPMSFAKTHRDIQLRIFVDHDGNILMKLNQPSTDPQQECYTWTNIARNSEAEEKAIIAKAMKQFYDYVKAGRSAVKTT